MPIRNPHPVATLREALHNRRTICEPRGHCGPFVNQHVYDEAPDSEWHGMGECVHCRNTLATGPELRKRLGREEKPFEEAAAD